MSYLRQTSTSHDQSQNSIIITTIIIHRQRNGTAAINRMRKDRCQKSRVLLHFVTHSRSRAADSGTCRDVYSEATEFKFLIGSYKTAKFDYLLGGCEQFLPRDATQSAVMPQYVVRPSICLSVGL